VKPALLEDEMTENAAVEYDPYGARLGRTRSSDRFGLVVREACELALGRRFVTVEHGDPTTLAESEVLTDVYAGLRSMAQRADWSRARGGPTFISVTFGGRRADEFASSARRLAESQNPGWWVISECPYPDAFV
jgi:hypothetical protein